MKYQHLLLSSLAILSVGVSHAGGDNRLDTNDEADAVIEWNQGLLSINAKNISTGELVHLIADKVGLHVQGADVLNGRINTQFSGLTLGEGLRTILAGTSYALVGRGSEYALSILSAAHPAPLPQSDADPSPETLATAGYIPDEYRKLYGWAERGELDKLAQAVAQGDLPTQALALQLLAKQDSEQAKRLATETFASSDENQRINAIQALTEIDDVAITGILAQALRDSSPAIRQAAVLILKTQTAAEATDLLVEALGNRDSAVRLLALDVLAERGGDSVAAIRSAANDPDPGVKGHAMRLLRQMSAFE